MTAIFMDGFDHYGTGSASINNMLDGSYVQMSAQCLIPPWGPARTGQYCLRGAGNNHYAVPTPGNLFFLSFGFSVDTLSINLPHPICFYTNSLATIMYLQVLANGQLQVVNGAGTILATSNGIVIKTENWHFLEMSLDTGAGTFTLRVDDPAASNTPLFTITSSTLAGPVIAIFGLMDGGSSPVNIDDLFVRDGAGSVNNGFLGDRQIATLLADADTAVAGWAPNYYHQLGAGILNNTTTNASVYATPASAMNIGAGDFTIETFVRFQTLPTGSTKMVIFGEWDEVNNLRGYQLFLGSFALNGGSLCFQTSTDGTVSTVQQPIVYPWEPALDTWYNIAIVRASGEDLLFVNGQQLGLPITDSRTYFSGSNSKFILCGQTNTSSNTPITGTSLDGWIDEIRFTNGFARYTANYTPTTVEYPRNIGGDPHFADVTLLCGFDSQIQDESSYARTLFSLGGSAQFTVNDGPLVGAWSTIGKAVPDDNTFIEAAFLSATAILTVTVNPANTNTVTVGTKNGSTPAVYTFKTALTSAFDVLIDVNIQQSLQNLFNAINAGPGSGTKYGTATTANFDVNAIQLPAGQMQVAANLPGTGGNSIPCSESGLTGSWSSTTLLGGQNIPGPSNFQVQRLPPNTTLISAVQITTRAFKSDSGLGSINSAFVGPLGTVQASPTHNLTLSPNYYNDIHETDPDVGGPISPTTITNGFVQVNRDT